MRKWIGLLLIFAVLGVFFSENSVALANEKEKKKEYIVVTKNESEYDRLIKKFNGDIVEEYQQYDNIDNTVFVAELTNSEVSNINSRDDVIAVEENIEVTALAEKQKRNKKQISSSTTENWNLKIIGADKSDIKKPKDNNKVRVAVLDSGVDPSEEVNVVQRVNLVEEEKELTTFLEDITGHGTSVAGVISDINPYADIYSVRVLNRENLGKLSEVINGIYWCVENHIDIINMSFGISQNSKVLESAIQEAEKNGILMFAAVGNEGKENSVNYPAAFPEVVAIGAVDSMANKTAESNSGNSVELVAPGHQVLADGAFGGEVVVGGTSIAVPHAVGCASLIWQKDKKQSSKFIRTVLAASAKNLGEHKKYGNGLLDVSYAIQNYKYFCEKYKEKNFEEDLSITENVNTEAIEVFEDIELVEGKWYTYSGGANGSKDGHNVIIDNSTVEGSSDKILLIIKQASAFADGLGCMNENNKNLMKHSTQLVIHGRHNYVATLNYLYDISRALYFCNDSNVNVEKICHECEYKIDFGDYYKYVTVRERLTEAVKFICHPTTAFSPRYNTNEIPINKQYAYRVLGLATHLTQDVYAHKTRVPTNVYASGSPFENGRGVRASDLTVDWNSFKELVNNKLTFAQIKNYIKKNIDGKREVNYEDEPTFYPERFKAAQGATRTLFSYFFSGKKILEADKVFMQNTITECKCAFLDKYVECVYGKTRAEKCAIYKFTPAKGDSWVQSWVNEPYLSGK